MSRLPPGPPPPPTVQRLRIRYAKRGRLRFTSHRDVARMLERALRRAEIPMAYSAGFSPHPKMSYAGAAPTGVASEAEYLEIGLAERRDPAQVRAALDAALPDGIDIVDVVEAVAGQGPSLADRIAASHWLIRLPGVDIAEAQRAADHLLAMTEAPVQRATKDGFRTVDARGTIQTLRVGDGASHADGTPEMGPCATLDLVVRHSTPAVRPDDVLTALRTAAGLTTPVAPVVTRLAQGLLDDTSPGDAERLIDPLG
jgi:radical SAM-linked protein